MAAVSAPAAAFILPIGHEKYFIPHYNKNTIERDRLKYERAINSWEKDTFKRLAGLNLTLYRHHDDEKKPDMYLCPRCEKYYETPICPWSPRNAGEDIFFHNHYDPQKDQRTESDVEMYIEPVTFCSAYPPYLKGVLSKKQEELIQKRFIFNKIKNRTAAMNLIARVRNLNKKASRPQQQPNALRDSVTVEEIKTKEEQAEIAAQEKATSIYMRHLRMLNSDHNTTDISNTPPPKTAATTTAATILNRVEAQSKWPCLVCKKTFNSPREFVAHVQKDNGAENTKIITIVKLDATDKNNHMELNHAVVKANAKPIAKCSDRELNRFRNWWLLSNIVRVVADGSDPRAPRGQLLYYMDKTTFKKYTDSELVYEDQKFRQQMLCHVVARNTQSTKPRQQVRGVPIAPADGSGDGGRRREGLQGYDDDGAVGDIFIETDMNNIAHFVQQFELPRVEERAWERRIHIAVGGQASPRFRWNLHNLTPPYSRATDGPLIREATAYSTSTNELLFYTTLLLNLWYADDIKNSRPDPKNPVACFKKFVLDFVNPTFPLLRTYLDYYTALDVDVDLPERYVTKFEEFIANPGLAGTEVDDLEFADFHSVSYEG